MSHKYTLKYNNKTGILKIILISSVNNNKSNTIKKTTKTTRLGTKSIPKNLIPFHRDRGGVNGLENGSFPDGLNHIMA